MNSQRLTSPKMKSFPWRIARRRLGLLVLPFLAVALNARATTVIPPNFDELVSRAQVIFEGNVTAVQSQWIGEGSEHRIVTFVTFKVNDALKGNPGASYTIRMLGGTVDGRTMRVTDAPEFAVGDRDLLFVENNGSQFIPLVGIQHGQFRIQKDATGADMLMTGEDQPLADVSQLGADEPQIARNRRPLSLRDFKTAVQAKVQAQQAKANTP
jgi:hypothetical protein